MIQSSVVLKNQYQSNMDYLLLDNITLNFQIGIILI